jgi:hypothetical protein
VAQDLRPAEAAVIHNEKRRISSLKYTSSRSPVIYVAGGPKMAMYEEIIESPGRILDGGRDSSRKFS